MISGSERCDEMRSELTALLDGELPQQKEEEVSGHLRECSSCMREKRALEQTWDLLELLESIEPKEEESPRFRERVLAARTRRLYRRVSFSAAAAVLLVALATLFWNPAASSPSGELEEVDREVIANLDRLGKEGFDIGLKMALLNNLHVLDQFSVSDLEWIRATRFEDRNIPGGR